MFRLFRNLFLVAPSRCALISISSSFFGQSERCSGKQDEPRAKQEGRSWRPALLGMNKNWTDSSQTISNVWEPVVIHGGIHWSFRWPGQKLLSGRLWPGIHWLENTSRGLQRKTRMCLLCFPLDEGHDRAECRSLRDWSQTLNHTVYSRNWQAKIPLTSSNGTVLQNELSASCEPVIWVFPFN